MRRIILTLAAGALLLGALLTSGAGHHGCSPQWQYGGTGNVYRWSQQC